MKKKSISRLLLIYVSLSCMSIFVKAETEADFRMLQSAPAQNADPTTSEGEIKDTRRKDDSTWIVGYLDDAHSLRPKGNNGKKGRHGVYD